MSWKLRLYLNLDMPEYILCGNVMVEIDQLLGTVAQAGGSDLHLAVGNPPVARVHGELKMVQASGAVQPQDMEQVLRAVATPQQVADFERDKELDFSYSLPGVARFRVNAAYQRGTISLFFRVLSAEIPNAKDLGLPPVCLELATQLHGLVLVTGVTGSGKSTTLAAMLNHINENQSCRIITLEDPIEFVHPNKKCMVIQREVGADTHSFSEALRRALPQDPDVIMVGELRDLDSVSLAITAAETGHLVLGTLHTNGAAECIERIVGVFPGDQQEQIQYQLSIGLAGVIFQSLMPTADGKGRVAAHEILVGTSAVRNLIRQNQIAQLKSFMFMAGQAGMQTLDQALANLVQRELITREEAYTRAPDTATLDRLLVPQGSDVSDVSGGLRSVTQRGAGQRPTP